MTLKNFNRIMAEVGARQVPEPDDGEDGEPTIEVHKDAETREVVLSETTAVFDAASGNMIVSVPLAERQSGDPGRDRFNRIMARVGGRQV